VVFPCVDAGRNTFCWRAENTPNRTPPATGLSFLLTGGIRNDRLATMSLQTRIDDDIKDAMRAKDAAKLGVLRLLKAAMKNAAIEKGGADAVLEDSEATAVIRKQIKQRQDSIEGYTKGGREELARAEQAEIEVLTPYLPAAMDSAALEQLVRDAIAEAGATSRQQMGAVMKIAAEKAGGRADGRALSAEVGRQLS